VIDEGNECFIDYIQLGLRSIARPLEINGRFYRLISYGAPSQGCDKAIDIIDKEKEK